MTRRSSSLSGRRLFLTGLGGATLALPFLPSFTGGSGHGVLSELAGGRAHADDAAPKRIVFWFAPWGATPDAYEPFGAGDGGAYELNRVMRPLDEFRDRMTVLSGINMASVFLQEGRAGNHEIGSANAMTAAGRTHVFPWGPDTPVSSPRGPSIDQVIANRLAPPTRFRTLQIGDSSDHLDQFLQTEDGQDVPLMTWPGDVYDRCFADFAGEESGRERILRSRRSVLDAVLPGYRHLAPRLNADDRATLDAHLTSLDELKRRLDTPAACVAPADPLRTSWDGANVVYPDPQGPYVPLFDLAARALLCDLTRVMTVRFTGGRAQVRSVVSRYDEINPPNSIGDAHSFSHATWEETQNIEVWKELQTWRNTMLRDFLRTLDSVRDVDGRTVLDNTVVVHVSEIMTGLHEGMPLQEWGYANPVATPPARPKGMPYFFIGGCGGALRTGGYHDFSRTHTYADGLGKYSHGELFLTMARAMGIGSDRLATFGTPEVCQRTIDEILV